MENNTIVIILAALFAVSEALSLIPVIKANGIFQLACSILLRLTGKSK